MCKESLVENKEKEKVIVQLNIVALFLSFLDYRYIQISNCTIHQYNIIIINYSFRPNIVKSFYFVGLKIIVSLPNLTNQCIFLKLFTFLSVDTNFKQKFMHV